jgi:hypothetical protein
MNTEPMYQPVVIPVSYTRHEFEPSAPRHEFEPTAPPFDPGYQSIACIICNYTGYPSQQRTFPCGCIHPIHDDCVVLFKQHEYVCPLCGTLWTFANRLQTIPPLASPPPKRCTIWFTLFAIFISVIAVCGTGLIVYLSVKNVF